MGRLGIAQHRHRQSGVFDTRSARRIMRPVSEDMPWMVAGNSWPVARKAQVMPSLVLLVDATGTSTEEKSRQRSSVSTRRLLILVTDS